MNDLHSPNDLQGVMKQPPTGYFLVVPGPQDDEAITFAALIVLLRRRWRVVLLASVAGAAIAAGVAFLMRDTYRAEAIVTPVEQTEQSGPGGALKNQFGGIAALAGLDLGLNVGPREEAFAMLASPGFAREFILSQNLMPILFAERWDARTQNWRSGTRPPKVEEGVKKLVKRVRTLTQDKRTGFVTVAVEWYSPELSARWVNAMIDMVNERMRSEAIHTAEQSIEYLNKELAKTTVVELRQAIYRLIETQVNKAMVANVERQYALRFIDRAIAPELHTNPKRAVWTAIGGVVGLFAGITFVLIRNFLQTSRPLLQDVHGKAAG